MRPVNCQPQPFWPDLGFVGDGPDEGSVRGLEAARAAHAQPGPAGAVALADRANLLCRGQQRAGPFGGEPAAGMQLFICTRQQLRGQEGNDHLVSEIVPAK